MDRKVPFVVGEVYHVYNRGVDKKKIFFKDSDWKHFQKLLYTRNSNKRIDSTRVKNTPLSKIKRGDTLVDLLAYVMMPNHFHLLLREKVEGGISAFMSKLATAHAMYVNTKYERSGPLMCRPFRSKHINNDEYFCWCFCYIHTNPLKSERDGMQESYLEKYHYSSYRDYFSTPREESLIINKDALPVEVTNLKTLKEMNKVLLS